MGGDAEGLHPDLINALDVSCLLTRAGALCPLVSAVVRLGVLAASPHSSQAPRSAFASIHGVFNPY